MGHIQQTNLRKILTKHGGYEDIKIFIETGTNSGLQNRIAIDSKLFDTVYGIELDKHWYEVSTKKNPESIMIHGDSSVELPMLLNNHKSEQLFIYLDAHYCHTNPRIEKSEFPLWKELEAIKNRGMNDIVLIDDVHTFGLNRSDLRFSEDSKEWETVTTDNINDFFGSRRLDSMTIDDSYVVWLLKE